MIIVNFSTKEYSRPQRRLIQSLNGHKQLMFNDYITINSPTHQESPYQFKIHAIEAAWEYDPIVLWADSSMYRVGDIKVIEDIIIKDGFFATEAGHYAGRWTNQFSRDYFKVTDEEMELSERGIKLFSAGLMGLDKNNELTQRFFKEWKASGEAGCFKGSWLDHRHEMTAASIIATRLGFQYQRGGQYLSYIGPGYAKPESTSIFYAQGMA